MILPQGLRRSGFEPDLMGVQLAARIIEETGPVVTYRLTPEEIQRVIRHEAAPAELMSRRGGSGVAAHIVGDRAAELRGKGRVMYAAGYSLSRICKELGVTWATGKRWETQEGWTRTEGTDQGQAARPEAAAARKTNGLANNHQTTPAATKPQRPGPVLLGGAWGEGAAPVDPSEEHELLIGTSGSGKARRVIIPANHLDELVPKPTEHPAVVSSTTILSRAQALDLHGLALQTLILVPPSPEAEQMPAVLLARQVAALCRRILVPEASGQ